MITLDNVVRSMTSAIEREPSCIKDLTDYCIALALSGQHHVSSHVGEKVSALMLLLSQLSQRQATLGVKVSENGLWSDICQQHEALLLRHPQDEGLRALAVLLREIREFCASPDVRTLSSKGVEVLSNVSRHYNGPGSFRLHCA